MQAKPHASKLALSRESIPQVAQWHQEICTCNDSMHRVALYALALTIPLSMTYRTPGMVTDVSAMLVAKITFRVSLGTSLNACTCSSGDNEAYIGTGSSIMP